MTFSEVYEFIETKYNEFSKISLYLNERGKNMLDTYSIILDKAEFCNTNEELVNDINRVIERFDENNAIVKNLKGFIKQIG